MRIPIFLIFLILVNACTNNPRNTTDVNIDESIAQHNATADPDDKIICKREKVIGTNITKKVCRTARLIREESEMSQKNVQKDIERMRRRTTPSGGD